MEENKEIKENNNQQEKPAENLTLAPIKKTNGIVVVLTIIIVLLVCGLVYMLLFYKDKEEVKEEDNKDSQYQLVVYKRIDNGNLCITDYCSKSTDYTEAFKIPVKSTYANLLKIDDDNSFVLYNDGNLSIYDIKKKSSTRTSFAGCYVTPYDVCKDYEYDIYKNENGEKVIGIGYKNEENHLGYFNLVIDKALYFDKYTSPYLSIRQLSDKYIALDSEDYTYILNTNKEEIKMKKKYPNNGYCAYKSNGDSNGYFYMLECGNEDTSIVTEMYDNDLNKIDINFDEYSFYKNNLYALDKGYIKKYDIKGNNVFTSEEYNDVKAMVNNYIFYIKDGNLTIENIDNPSESKSLEKWDNEWFIDFARQFSRKELDDMEEEDKKEGIYIVVYYSNEGDKKDSKGNYGMEYCYTSSKEVVEYAIKNEMGGRAKPVLYLYPTKETNVTVKFAHPELLTTTYPKYINSWNVTVKPNGDMKDKDGKYYYALYWDEKRYNEVDFKEGFYVEGKDAIKFLEEKLAIIGLNEKETNEFIMYWLPIMEANGKNLVYFELTDEREAGNKLIIDPKPDSLLRVSIHIKKVNKRVNIKEQKLSTFNRVGFAAIEWGGMTY